MKWRRRLKWPVTVLTVLLLVVWVGSGWRGFHHYDPSRVVVVTRGLLVYFEDWVPPGFRRTSWSAHEFDILWARRDTFDRDWVVIPLWIPLVGLLPAAIYFHRVTRRPPGHCTRCNYDLRDIDGPCPECGADR